MSTTSRRAGAAGLVLSFCAAFAACSGAEVDELFPDDSPPDAGAGGQGGEAPDAGPVGCEACGGDTPICLEGDHCVATCPEARAACATEGDGAPPSCCPYGDQCCAAAVHGYVGPDQCHPNNLPCPAPCPDGTTVCPPDQDCQLDPQSGTYACVADCPDAAVCGQNLCCPLGSGCAGDACALPDLTINAQRVASSADIKVRTFAADSCEVFEGCIVAPGTRTLLRFDLETPNVGEGDLRLGVPEGNPLFTFSPCHNHYHFDGYANYRLLDQDSQVVATGHKQAFCLLDLARVDPAAPPDAVYSCANQGIQAGWADVYGRSLACQWVDVTDVPPGSYLLEVQVNQDHTLAESSYANNAVAVPVTVPANTCPGGCRPLDAACCQPGDPCGWGADGSCDCAGAFAWDVTDCSSCISGDPDCNLSNTCPGGCTPNVGPCCDAGNACNLDNNGACDCGGVFDWDTNDCTECTTSDPDCPVNTCPNGCTPLDPNNMCCQDGVACGWDNDGWCDCGGAAWDAADCALCISNDPDCP